MRIPNNGSFVRIMMNDAILEGVITEHSSTEVLLVLNDGAKAIISRDAIQYILIRPEEPTNGPA